MVPEQASVVVGATAVAEHSPVTSAKTGVNGFVISSITTSWVTLIAFPLPSSKFQVMVWVPWVE